MTSIAEAARGVLAGEVAIIPTDTVYGLAASAARPGALEALFALKSRPKDKALPVLGADAEQLSAVASFDERAARLARTFWPGALTLVLERAAGFAADLGGEDDGTVAVRVPAHPFALELLEQTGPLAVTSANRSGEPPASTLAEARETFGDSVALWIDGGRCRGAASTIVRATGEMAVLREGPVPGTEVEQALLSR